MKNVLSTVDGRIDAFRDRLYKLNQEFSSGVALQTELTIIRMVTTVDSMGMHFLRNYPLALLI